MKLCDFCGKLNENLESTNTQTKDLTKTTIKLREILSSSQKRGQWGERIVEDILIKSMNLLSFRIAHFI